MRFKYLSSQVIGSAETSRADRLLRGCIDYWVTQLLYKFLESCQDLGYSNMIKNWNCLISIPVEPSDRDHEVKWFWDILTLCERTCLNTEASALEIRDLETVYWHIRARLVGRVPEETVIVLDCLVASIMLVIADRRGIVDIAPLLDGLIFF
jgi:hypothetical protein